MKTVDKEKPPEIMFLGNDICFVKTVFKFKYKLIAELKSHELASTHYFHAGNNK